MNSRRQRLLWMILPLAALAVFLYIRICAPDSTEQPQVQEEQPTPSVTTEEGLTTQAPPSTVPETPSEAALPEVIEVCPTQIMEGFATDYTGGAWATQVTHETIIEITCGLNAGTYKVYVVDFSTGIYEEPDLYLETCGDPMCTGAYGFVTLERI